MQFVSFSFLLLLPVAAFINFIIPDRYRYIWLFFISTAFYLSIDVRSAAVMAATVGITYAAGLLIEKQKAHAKVIVIAAVAVLAAAMFVLRSGNILGAVGISFYMLKSISYLIDVYRGDLQAEKNFLRLALFVSFFTQVLSGPIERARNMLPQFESPVTVDYDRLRDGVMQILWGYFLKLVLADRIAVFVNNVYSRAGSADGTIVAIATFFYSFEIYCDFAGYSAIAIGTSRILGIDVMKNFDCPYLSANIAEFWRRWHISLSTWLRDYIYIPLGGNRKGVVRKYINILIVFAISGIWHGSALTFLVWGVLHALYQIAGFLTMPVRDRIVEVLGIKREGLSHRTIKSLLTFFLVNFAWIFFRAADMKQAFVIIKKSFQFTPWVFTDSSLTRYGLSELNLNVVMAGLVLLGIVDVLTYNGYEIRKLIVRQGIWYRWAIMIAAIVLILVLGMWGAGYNASSFIYQQF